MTRIEKCENAIKLGFLYDELTGEITTPSGVIAKKKTKNGYLLLTIRFNKEVAYLVGHQFAWYFKHKECVPLIDHKNRVKTDNRIDNLRSITKQQNAFNMDVKGSSFDKRNQRYSSGITVNGVKKFLGYFETEEEARNAYIYAKVKYHKIN